MLYVLVEIANYSQLSRLRAPEVAELRALLGNFSSNRGGNLVREHSGFFLFSFHPNREKVLNLVSDFLFLTRESLERKKEELFGFNLLLEIDDSPDDLQVLGRLKSLLFSAPKENSVWAGKTVLPHLAGVFPVADGEALSEILGPPEQQGMTPLTFFQLLEMTGWTEALQAPLARQLPDAPTPAGKVIRLKGTHLTEKVFVLRSILHHLYGTQEGFPVVFPLVESHDFLSQLLGQVDTQALKRMQVPEPSWEFLLSSQGAGEFPGDSSRKEVSSALALYYRALIGDLKSQGLPPVFIFLSPQEYEPAAATILEELLSSLISQEGLWVLILEPAERKQEFMTRVPSLAWNFPALNLSRALKERDARGWQDRFPDLSAEALALCDERGASFTHYLVGLQEKRWTGTGRLEQDPSWSLLVSLDTSHHKIYLVFLASRALLNEESLVGFFQFLGEDPAVIRDKVENLKTLGYIVFGLNNLALRPDFRVPLNELLGHEAFELQQKLGHFVHSRWLNDRQLSEVVFQLLRSCEHYSKALEVLWHYATHKINRNEGDFLPLLRPSLWERITSEEVRDEYRLLSAALKLRFALNQSGKTWTHDSLVVFKRFFTPRTESRASPEWTLQKGRFQLRLGNLSEGFALLKQALLAAQDQRLTLLEIRANTEIGLTLLRKKKLEEGREYFDIASRMAEKAGSVYAIVVNSTLDALCLFLLGYLSSSVKVLERTEPVIERSGMQESKIFWTFLRARIEFDRGDYSRALEYLESALKVAHSYSRQNAAEVLGLWKARCEAYSGNTRVAKALLEARAEGLERDYFLAEAHYFERNSALALEIVRRGLKLVQKTQPFSSESHSWTTGYSGFEDRVLGREGEKGVLEGQAEAFSVLLEGQLENVELSSQRFQTLLAQKSLLELDVVSAQYYFWYYLVLPRNAADQEALRLTLLGRALKAIQSRAARIEDPLQRQEFLHRPYWNAQYLSEGKRLKLL